jgi:hypothetical protein
MNKEEAIEQLYRLSLDWEENGLDTKLNQTDINAIKIIVGELDIANKKLEETKEYINKNIRHEYRNGRNNEFYLELNENKLKQLQSIIGGE